MMDCTTDGLECVFAYMGDSCVGSPDRQTHLYHLEAFFTALAVNGLAINLEKCVFATPSLEILGHRISATGAAPTANHAAEIENCPPPQDIKQLQRFPGMLNFYRRFLPNCAQVLKPLTDLLRGGAKTLERTISTQEAFQNAKRLLAAAVPLQHPTPNAELSLATIAYDTHIGGVMQQKSGDHLQPLVFSRKLTDTESCYSTFDRELLAAQAAIKHFRHFCQGRTFQLWTNHKPLVTAITLCYSPHFAQITMPFGVHLRIYVQLFYLPELKNVVADFLSRPTQTTAGSVATTSAADPVDFEEMAAEQNCCPETQRLLGGTSLKLAFCQTGAQRLAGPQPIPIA